MGLVGAVRPDFKRSYSLVGIERIVVKRWWWSPFTISLVSVLFFADQVLDLTPDAIPFVGLVDDVGVIAYGARSLAETISACRGLAWGRLLIPPHAIKPPRKW